MPGSDFAKNGRISRKLARIGSSTPSKSRRIAFQSGVIGGSSASVVGSAHLMCAWLTDCEFIRGSTKVRKFERKKGPERGFGAVFFALSQSGGWLADRDFQDAYAVDPAFDLVAGREC